MNPEERVKILPKVSKIATPVKGAYPAIPDRVVLSNSFHDVAKKPRATIDVAGVNLKKLGAGFEFLTGGFCIANSAGSDHGDFGFCENAAHQRR